MVKVKHKRKRAQIFRFNRVYFLIFSFIFFGLLIIAQLFRVQVLYHSLYASEAHGQRNKVNEIVGRRGQIYWQDLFQEDTAPLVINRSMYNFYFVPNKIRNSLQFAEKVSLILNVTQEDILAKLNRKTDPYERLSQRLTENQKNFIIQELKRFDILEETYGFEEEIDRYYMEGNLTSHITGFLGFDSDGSRRGQYGLEEYFDPELRGVNGIVVSDNDVEGRPIAIGERVVKDADDGDDIVLTLDKNIQYKACSLLSEYVVRFEAQGGVVIIMNPMNGKLYAMCSNPDFNPNEYGKEEQGSFINAAVAESYEPGSIFKTITMAAALDTGEVDPWTTYIDTGAVPIGSYIIRNSDSKAHGLNTMIRVLDQSLNTGAVFAMRATGTKHFKSYVEKFGFGRLTGIELPGEALGDIKPLENNKEIYFATASFGQGITVTPIQLVNGYAAIARGGRLIKPRIIERIGSQTTRLQEGEQAISPETARTLTMMLVSSVKNGYAKMAGVPGYTIAGKTGTAQVPKSDGRGYSDESVHSFVGFGPVGSLNPVFVALTRLDKPAKARFASSSAAPLFQEIAKFILNYLKIPPQENEE